MKKLLKFPLVAVVFLGASVSLQSGLARQDGSHAGHDNHDQTSAQNEIVLDEVMQAGQGADPGGTMPDRGNGGQGNRMQNRGNGDNGGQGSMMQNRGSGGSGGMMQNAENQSQGERMQRMQQMRRRMAASDEFATLAGQDAVSVISRVVRQLESDPETDWSAVNIEALREHLVDMHHLALYASVSAESIGGGAIFRVTGDDRTLIAIQRMVPTHAAQMRSETDWTVISREMENGVELTVTAPSADQAMKIRGLGFMGFMTSGEHHDRHHLAIAGGKTDSGQHGAGASGSGGGHGH